MTVDPNLLDLYNDTVDRLPVSGVDRNNEPVYGAPIVGEQCKIVQQQVRVLVDGAAEESIISSTQVHYPEEKTVDVRDRITLPAPFSPTMPKIIKVEQHTGVEPGIQHTVVML